MNNNISPTISNFKTRMLAGAVLATVIISALILSKYTAYAVFAVIGIGMIIEWSNMTQDRLIPNLIGLVVILPAIISSCILISIMPNNNLLIAMFILVWTYDTFAMIGGKKIGGAKLAPKISPNKTISGLIVGVICSGFAMYITKYVNPNIFAYCKILDDFPPFLLGFSLGFISQIGDLTESYFKRKFNIKDSGNIIPGHGGILDRFDSLIFIAPIFLIAVWVDKFY